MRMPLTASAFSVFTGVLSYVIYSTVPPALVHAVFVFCLVYVADGDARYERIPNRVVIPLLPLALLLAPYSVVLGGEITWQSYVSPVSGALVGLAVFLPVYQIGKGRLGGGDVKFATVCGGMAGFPFVLVALLLGTVVASGGLLYAKFSKRPTTVPFGPYLAASTSVTIVSSGLLKSLVAF